MSENNATESQETDENGLVLPIIEEILISISSIDDESVKLDTFLAASKLEKVLKMAGILSSMSQKARAAMVEKAIDLGFLDLIIKALFYIDGKDKLPDNLSVFGVSCLFLDLMSSFTDCSRRASLILMENGLVALLIRNISKEEYQNRMETGSVEYFISLNLCTIHNIAKLPESQELFDEVNAIGAIEFYFAAERSEKVQISALSSVACILDESAVAKTCLDKYKIISKLVKCLEKAMEETPEHSYIGFSAEELVESLTFLAVCDYNKHTIVDSGAIPPLIKMLASSEPIEQLRATDCLWALSFDESIRLKIVSFEGCLELLGSIGQTAPSDECRLKARRALSYITLGKVGLVETVREQQQSLAVVKSPAKKRSDSFPEEEEALESVSCIAGDVDERKGHIFISYSWKHQDVVLKIRDCLVANGFDVWIDVDKMHGSTLDAMARAIEDACFVLLCYSENYRQSNNCRAEAEYIFNRRKPFIPLNMQHPSYQPTGWLGIMLGSKLYVDFSLKDSSFESCQAKLFVQISGMKASLGDSADTAAIQTVQSVISEDSGLTGISTPSSKVDTRLSVISENSSLVSHISQTFAQNLATLISKNATTSGTMEKLKSWSVDEVRDWLKSESLEHLSRHKSFSAFDGRALYGLAQMKASAPKLYYKQALKMFNKSLIDCLQFSTALDTLAVSSS